LINDASNDDTETIALHFPCHVISLQRNIMAANCRNLGAELARGEILVFFDSDQLMLTDTLRRYVEALDAHPEVDAVVGSLAADTTISNFFCRFKNFQHHYTHQTARTEGATLASGLTAVRRSVFLQMGGFEPAFSGSSVEDIALGYRMIRAGHRIRFNPEIQVVHLKAYTFRSLVFSDIVHRAIPWTGLMLRERIFRNDLNTRSVNVFSVAAAWLIPPGLAAAAFGWMPGLLLAGAATSAIAILNAAFLKAAWDHFGTWFVVRTVGLLPAVYFYHGVGLIAGIVAYLHGGSVAARRDRPQCTYRVREGTASPAELRFVSQSHQSESF